MRLTGDASGRGWRGVWTVVAGRGKTRCLDRGHWSLDMVKRGVWTVVAAGVAGLIFVIDSADQDRIKEAQHELVNVVTSDEMRGVPVEIFANKQDLPSTRATLAFRSLFCCHCRPAAQNWYCG